MPAFGAPCYLGRNGECPRKSFDGQNRRRSHANWDWNELLIFFQSALIMFLGDPERSANDA